MFAQCEATELMVLSTYEQKGHTCSALYRASR